MASAATTITPVNGATAAITRNTMPATPSTSARRPSFGAVPRESSAAMSSPSHLTGQWHCDHTRQRVMMITGQQRSSIENRSSAGEMIGTDGTTLAHAGTADSPQNRTSHVMIVMPHTVTCVILQDWSGTAPHANSRGSEDRSERFTSERVCVTVSDAYGVWRAGVHPV